MGRMSDLAADVETASALNPVDGDYSGYANHQFLAAFDLLCKKAGGYQAGKQQAIELIKQQVES